MSVEYKQSMKETAARLLFNLRKILKILRSVEQDLKDFSKHWSKHNKEDEILEHSRKILESMQYYVFHAILEAQLLDDAYTKFFKTILSEKELETLLATEANRERKGLYKRPLFVPNVNRHNDESDWLHGIGNLLGEAGKTIENAWKTIFDSPPPPGRPINNNSVFSRALYPVTCARCMKHIRMLH